MRGSGIRLVAASATGVLLYGAAALVGQGQRADGGPQGHLTGPTFRADYSFGGSALTGWRSVGQASWRAQNGEIVGVASGGGGGWLILDRSAQDVAVYATMLCTGECKSGVLLRAEKTADGGMKGVFQSFADGDLSSYLVTLDAQGREVTREKLAPPPPPPGRAGGGGNRGAAAPIPPVTDPVLASISRRPEGTYKPGQWNEVEVFVTENSVRPKFNGGALGGNPAQMMVPETGQDGFGVVALYVGSGEVRLRNFRYKDLLTRAIGVQETSSNFRAQQLNDIYYSWSAAAADFNRDGVMDVAAGPFIYLGPDFATAREVFTPVAYNPLNSYPLGSMVNLAYDFTGDGWVDQLVMSGNAGNGTGTLFVNPGNDSRHWKKYVVVDPVGNEDTLLKDIDGDGKPEIIHAGDNALRYSKPDPANPTGKWITRTISEPGLWGVNIGHGLGVGDINSDGRMDFLTTYGWWEQPANNTAGQLWAHHPAVFGRWGNSQGGAGGAEVAVYDVNGDGLNDVVTALEGHGFGLGWYEQKRTDGAIAFVEHIIMDNFLTKNAGDVTFTEPHAATYADIDGDGLPDFITGKRFMSHFGYTDPDPYGPAVVYVYKTRRNPRAPGGAEFVPELVHNRSGVGSRFAIADLNGDGSNDIITSANFGTFVFFNNIRRQRNTAAR